jgi:hypothetical protein
MLCESRDERIVVCGQWGKKLARPYFKKQVVNWRCGSSESACPVALSLIATTTIKKKQSKKKKKQNKTKTQLGAMEHTCSVNYAGGS